MSSCIEYIQNIQGFSFSYISPPLEQRLHIPFSLQYTLAYCMCSKKFGGDFNKAPWKEPLVLVIINLDFVVVSLIYFSPRCFDLKDFNIKKRFEPLRKDSHCLVSNVCCFNTLPNQTAAS